MGRRGPRPKPAAEHKRRGSYRADRHGGGILTGEMPAKPEELSERASEEWDRLAPLMVEAGILHPRFQAAFAAYCECLAEYWAHKETIAEQGATIVTQKGNLIQHPCVGMAGKCLDRMVKLARELGLTPASATGLQPGKDEPGDALDRLAAQRSQRTEPKSNPGSPTSSPAASSRAGSSASRSKGTART
jgi:P27 family predicted phage terminase small subunit